jgi:hypothetical protein
MLAVRKTDRWFPSSISRPEPMKESKYVGSIVLGWMAQFSRIDTRNANN